MSDASSDDEFHSFEDEGDDAPSKVESSRPTQQQQDHDAVTMEEGFHTEDSDNDAPEVVSSKPAQKCIEPLQEEEYHTENSDQSEADDFLTSKEDVDSDGINVGIENGEEGEDEEEEEEEEEEEGDESHEENSNDVEEGMEVDNEEDEEVYEDNEAEENMDEDDLEAPSAPLLPPELLRAVPTSAPVMPKHTTFDLIDENLTRKEKKAARSRSRQAKKRVWDKLRRDSSGNGVVETALAAQAKRGVATRVQGGRIRKSTKKSKPVISGREKMVQSRRTDIQSRKKQLWDPPKSRLNAKK